MARTVWFALACITLTGSGAWAHGLGVECKVHAGKVWITAYYDDDTDAIDAQVLVLAGEREIAKGKTNHQGICTFAVPEPGKYQVIVDAGAGHKTKTSLTIQPESKEAKGPDVVSSDPSRAEATRYPWLRIGLGLGIVSLVAAAFFLVRQRRAG